jgi:hypothetical protein
VPKVSWSALMERHLAAHLVAGVLPEGAAIISNVRRQLNLMTKLIARLAPKGLYALTVDRQNPTPEIHCVFEKDSDALKLAKAVGAHSAGRYPGWASQRTFGDEALRGSVGTLELTWLGATATGGRAVAL